MRWLAGLAIVAALAAAAIATRAAGLWGEGSTPPVRLPGVELGGLVDDLLGEGSAIDRGLRGNGCERLSELAALISLETSDPRELLRRLGTEAAGIRRGPRGIADLARGGTDRILGRGFRARFSDGSDRQARHFAGIAVAATYGGEQATRLASIFVRRDPLNSADGRLTEEALDFSRMLLSGELAAEESGEWILEHLCRDL